MAVKKPVKKIARADLFFVNDEDDPRWVIDVEIPGQKGVMRRCKSPGPLITWLEKWASDRNLTVAMWSTTIGPKVEPQR